MKSTRHVLKADEVALEGPLQLSIDSSAGSGCGRAPRAPAAPRVRIVQTHAQYAVLEVTCPCGRTTHIRCDYEESRAR